MLAPFSRVSAGLQEAKSAWEDKRAVNTAPQGGGRKRQHERLAYSSYSREENFAEFFNVGRVTPLDEWLRDNGFVPAEIGDRAKQISFATEAGPC